MENNFCRICNSKDLEKLFCWSKFPIYIWPVEEGYEQEYESLQLNWCQQCGLLQLDNFPEEFIQKLYLRKVFGLVSTSEFPSAIIKNTEFIEYCLRVLGNDWCNEKTILDVGGYDLLFSFDLNYQEGIICDPNAPESVPYKNLNVCREFFSKKWFSQGYFDFVILKHILEHINDLSAFLVNIRHVLKEDGIVIIEVPNISSSLRKRAYTIFYHQHLTYFDEYSLRNLLEYSGFRIIDLDYCSNNIRVVAQKCTYGRVNQDFEMDDSIPARVKGYIDSLEIYSQEINSFLDRISGKEKSICYGAGGGTTLLLHINKDFSNYVECVVDSSMSKINKRIVGTPFVIRSPEILGSLFDKTIIINTIEFFDEILSDLREKYREHNFRYVRIVPSIEEIIYD
ncbi:MAG: class I SAM-dependent methyltransferase [Candidatus Brocadiaceae bacterium]|nr:class I SAM-dependent methyltransferase [Candidatus Brocadiaceae bacterium]